jgi:hypothetical protein
MSTSLVGIETYLDSVRIPLRLACHTKTGWPIVISLWYLHQNGVLFCATQESAKIVNYLKADPRCAFEVAEDKPPYCGVRGQAKAKIDFTMGAEILEKLIVRYLGNTESSLAKGLLSKTESEVAIVLEPVRIFKWDFTERMRNIKGINPNAKVCP